MQVFEDTAKGGLSRVKLAPLRSSKRDDGSTTCNLEVKN